MTSPLPAGTEMRRWAEAVHGSWDKSQERYADGTTARDALAEWNATRPSPLPLDEDREELSRVLITSFDYADTDPAVKDLADAILAAGFRRSVVSTPTDDVRDIYHPALIEGQERFEGDTARAGAFAVGAAWALEASAVSAPPTITDEMVERATIAFWHAMEPEPIIFREDYGYMRVALRAALGGEA